MGIVCGCEGPHRPLEEVQRVSAWQPRSALFKAPRGEGGQKLPRVIPQSHIMAMTAPYRALPS